MESEGDGDGVGHRKRQERKEGGRTMTMWHALWCNFTSSTLPSSVRNYRTEQLIFPTHPTRPTLDNGPSESRIIVSWLFLQSSCQGVSKTGSICDVRVPAEL